MEELKVFRRCALCNIPIVVNVSYFVDQNTGLAYHSKCFKPKLGHAPPIPKVEKKSKTKK